MLRKVRGGEAERTKPKSKARRSSGRWAQARLDWPLQPAPGHRGQPAQPPPPGLGSGWSELDSPVALSCPHPLPARIFRADRKEGGVARERATNRRVGSVLSARAPGCAPRPEGFPTEEPLSRSQAPKREEGVSTQQGAKHALARVHTPATESRCPRSCPCHRDCPSRPGLAGLGGQPCVGAWADDRTGEDWQPWAQCLGSVCSAAGPLARDPSLPVEALCAPRPSCYGDPAGRKAAEAWGHSSP